VSDCCLTTNEEFFSYNVARTSYIWWNDNDVCFVLDQPTLLDFDSAGWLKQQPTGRLVATLDSAGWLKQQPTGRHVATLVHIILILSQYVFPLAHESCVLSEAANFSFIGFGSTQLHIDIHDLLHLSRAR
jgi:hypothetical protein